MPPAALPLPRICCRRRAAPPRACIPRGGRARSLRPFCARMRACVHARACALDGCGSDARAHLAPRPTFKTPSLPARRTDPTQRWRARAPPPASAPTGPPPAGRPGSNPPPPRARPPACQPPAVEPAELLPPRLLLCCTINFGTSRGRRTSSSNREHQSSGARLPKHAHRQAAHGSGLPAARRGAHCPAAAAAASRAALRAAAATPGAGRGLLSPGDKCLTM